MTFRDSVTISKPASGTYSQQNTGPTHVVPAIVAMTGGVKRGGMFDINAGDATAYLDASDVWLKSVGYQISDYYVSCTKHGVTKLYKVTNDAIGERHASDGSVSHIEVELEEQA